MPSAGSLTNHATAFDRPSEVRWAGFPAGAPAPINARPGAVRPIEAGVLAALRHTRLSVLDLTPQTLSYAVSWALAAMEKDAGRAGTLPA